MGKIIYNLQKNGPWFQSRLCNLLSMWFWAKYVISLGLSFFFLSVSCRYNSCPIGLLVKVNEVTDKNAVSKLYKTIQVMFFKIVIRNFELNYTCFPPPSCVCPNAFWALQAVMATHVGAARLHRTRQLIILIKLSSEFKQPVFSVVPISCHTQPHSSDLKQWLVISYKYILQASDVVLGPSSPSTIFPGMLGTHALMICASNACDISIIQYKCYFKQALTDGGLNFIASPTFSRQNLQFNHQWAESGLIFLFCLMFSKQPSWKRDL